MLSVYRNISWILEALDESLASSVKVLDTGPIWNLKLNNSLINRLKMTVTPSGEEKHGEILSCSNPYETVIVAVVVRALLKVFIFKFIYFLEFVYFILFNFTFFYRFLNLFLIFD